MFQTILEFIKSNFLLSENDQMEIEKFLKSMEVTSAKLEQKMKLIGEKYNYENLNN